MNSEDRKHVEVIQADRDKAGREVEGDSDNPLRVAAANEFYEGRRDDHEITQRHARHRLASTPDVNAELLEALETELGEIEKDIRWVSERMESAIAKARGSRS